MERRDRLKELVSLKMMEGEEIEWEDSDTDDDGLQKEEYFTHGIDELREARKFILEYSIEQCAHPLCVIINLSLLIIYTSNI